MLPSLVNIRANARDEDLFAPLRPTAKTSDVHLNVFRTFLTVYDTCKEETMPEYKKWSEWWSNPMKSALYFYDRGDLQIAQVFGMSRQAWAAFGDAFMDMLASNEAFDDFEQVVEWSILWDIDQFVRVSEEEMEQLLDQLVEMKKGCEERIEERAQEREKRSVFEPEPKPRKPLDVEPQYRRNQWDEHEPIPRRKPPLRLFRSKKWNWREGTGSDDEWEVV
jgi:hypothetical protein